jgi:CheY-like chemotaxis protein
VTPQLPRLARVLQPRAVLLDLQSRGLEVVNALRAEPALDAVPILVFSRQRVSATESARGAAPSPAVEGAGDEELLRFVESPRGHA